jgi:C1A family cysteine protease
MVLPAMAMLIPSTEAQVALDRSSATGASFTDVNGITMRPMTDVDMLEMKEKVGTRIDGVNYDVIVDGYHTGLAPPSSESWERMVGNVMLAQIPEAMTLSAPSTYDMSTNSWFPTVGNQGGQGSCAAWAATYYCYGAVEAKDNGWTGSKTGNSAQLLSPAWTYNRVAVRSGGGGSWMSENFDVIKDWGVPTLAKFPYNDANAINWGGEAAWREAPLHRGSQVVIMDARGDLAINAIKNLVAADQPVTFAIDADEFTLSLGDDFVISANEYNSAFVLNHAQTIVGYNDSFVAAGHADIGAFRIVNSWGAGWGESGFYWISYDAFKKIMNVSGNELCYITDISHYTPSLLAIWHYNNPPKRIVEHTLTIGNPSSYLDIKAPYWVYDSLNVLPSFMVCDISEFRSYYDAGTIKFNLEVTGGAASVISSFRIESYENGYSPGAPTQASAQSLQVPKTTPGVLENNFPSYSPISPAQALDCAGIEVSNPGLTDWVGVDQTFVYGNSAMQAGDVGDSSTSVIQVSVTGYTGVSFFWKVSSEQSADYLRFYESTTKKMEISGNSGWKQVWYNFTGTGTHVLKWSYEKNSATSSLQDGAWIDRLQLLQSVTPEDSTPPITQANCIGDVGSNGWYKSEVDLALIPTDSGSGVDVTKYRIGSASWSNYGGVFHITEDGRHVVEFYSIDYAGNTEALKSVIILIDMSSPVSSSNLIGTMGSANWYVSEVLVNISASDGISGVSSIIYRLDESTVENYSGEISISSEGAHTLSYYSVDVAGNIENEQSIQFKIDTSLPTVHGTFDGTVGNTGWFISAVAVRIEGNDISSGIASIEYRMDNGSWNNYSNSISVQTEGEHTLECRGIDFAGNIGPVQSLDFMLDTIAPESVFSIDGVAGEQGWYVSTVGMAIIASDNTSGISQTFMRVNGGDWYVGNADEFSDGTYLIESYSTDIAGNSGPVVSVLINSDLEAPSTSHRLAGTMSENGWYTSNASLNLSADDNVSGVDSIVYRLDGGDWMTYLGIIAFDDEGAHIIEYRSFDQAGNEEIVRSYVVKVDKTAPTSSASIQGSEGVGGWHVSSLMINVSSSDDVSEVDFIDYRLDSGAWNVYSGQIVVDSSGSHLLEFYSQDRAGNIEAVKRLEFRIDRDDPTILLQIDGMIFTSKDVWLNWTANDSTSAVGTIELSIDGAPYQMFDATRSNITLLGLSDGPHSLSVQVTDLAGNEVISESSFVVDTNPLSSQGPYGSSLLIALVIVIALVVGLAIFRYRRR